MPISPAPRPSATAPQADAIYNVPAGEAYTHARARGYSFVAVTPEGGAAECAYRVMPDGALGLNITYEGSKWPGYLSAGEIRVFRMFGTIDLNAGWSFFGRIDVDSDVCGVGWVKFTNENYSESPAFQIWILANVNNRPNLLTRCLIHRWTISRFRLRGPAGSTWQHAFF
jgi:hypothetical protein